MKHQVEQRKHPRFLVAHGGVAALTDSRIGSIRDISRGGLAFRYFADEENDDNVSKSTEVCIVHDSGFSLLDIPCKIIGNPSSLPGHPHVFSKMSTCRIQFGRLTRDQKAQLDYFIAHFTISSAR